MATPSYSYVISQINTFIVANGNNEITANVLNPILELIIDFANNHMGDLDNLTTDETDTLVDAINSLKQNINDIVGNSVQLHVGNANPNDEPPLLYNYGDFYMQLSPLDNEPIQLWQFNGFEWFAPDAATSWGEIEGNIADQTDLQGALDLKADVTDLEDYQLLSEKGEANGYTPLDSGAKIPIEFLPDSVIGQVKYQGTWNASTNTPDVGDATTQKGYYYVTSVGGTYSGISYEVGDWIISNGVEWQKVDNTDAVVSVFGRIGAVVANSGDYASFYSPIITGGASTIVTDNLTASRALVSDGSGKVGVSSVTSTELGRVSGVTSPIQTQLDSKLPSSSYTAADVLTKIKTVDGTGSGLDADLLRGVHWGNVDTDIVNVSSSGVKQRSQNTVGGYIEVGISDNATSKGFINFTNSLSLEGGNVSIGNTNDTYKLDVSGTGRFTDTVIAAPATLSTELVTKGQLDAAIPSGSNTFTPTLIDAGGGATYSGTGNGTYIKMGDFVFFNASFTNISTSGVPSGELRFGLSDIGLGVDSVATITCRMNDNNVVGITTTSQDYIFFKEAGGSTNANIGSVTFTSPDAIFVSGFYKTND